MLAAMAKSGARRIVFVSSAHVYGMQRAGTAPAGEHDELNPVSAVGRHQARAEEMLAASGAEWVAIRSALIVGRDVDNWVQRLLACRCFPILTDRRAGGCRWCTPTTPFGYLPGPRWIPASVAGRSTWPPRRAGLSRGRSRPRTAVIALHFDPASKLLRGCAATFFDTLSLVQDAPLMDTSRLRDRWGCTPAWNANECVEDLALGLRGRVTVGKRVISLPWRISRIQDIPVADAPAADGKLPVLAGPEGKTASSTPRSIRDSRHSSRPTCPKRCPDRFRRRRFR
ncbi:NADH(P)-binding family protein [Mycobacterium xenopi 3993]|nr:NADH(P)-binding family protein [Mycobacterium xenopi 3993]